MRLLVDVNLEVHSSPLWGTLPHSQAVLVVANAFLPVSSSQLCKAQLLPLESSLPSRELGSELPAHLDSPDLAHAPHPFPQINLVLRFSSAHARGLQPVGIAPAFPGFLLSMNFP